MIRKVVCPLCGHKFDFDTEADEWNDQDGGGNGGPVVNCPNCPLCGRPVQVPSQPPH